MPELKVGEITLAYTDVGAGPAVILVHGSAAPRKQWRPLIEHLSGRYRCLAPDLIGYGRTTGWPADKKLSAKDEIALIAALVDLFDGPVHLVGHSYGGSLCLDASLTLSHRLRSLTLIEPVAFQLLRLEGDSEAWAEIEDLASRHIRFAREGRLAACADAMMSYWIGAAAWSAMPAEMRTAITATMPKIAAEWQMAFDSDVGLSAFAGVTAPTLLIRGTHTTLAAHRVVALLAKTLPRRHLIEIDGAGHMSPLTHAAEVNAAVAAHLERHADSRAKDVA